MNRPTTIKAQLRVWWDSLSNEKKAVSASFIVLIGVMFAMAISLEVNTTQRNVRGDQIPTFASGLPIQFEGVEGTSTSGKLKAMLKGSIYENGSNMTVYGACFDGDGFLLPGASTTFTAWYPNASIMIGPNASMDRVYADYDNPLANETTLPNGTGRWKIHVTMGDIIGTYLTEIRCEYGGEFAIAFGEWQNPEWVKRIELTQNQVNANYALLQVMQNQSQNNFTQVLNSIQGAITNITNQVGGDVEVSFIELEEAIRTIDRSNWVLDEDNPFYIVSSGVHMFTATDVLSPSRVAAVSSDGYYVTWDGETWTEEAVPGATFNGVSVLPATGGMYAWAVGDDGANPAISFSGSNLTNPTLPSGTPNTLNDVKLFLNPTTPALNFIAMILGDDGTIYASFDSGANWSAVGTIDSGSIGRFSQVVENYVSGAPVDGYIVAVVQGSDFAVYNGNNVTTYTRAGVTFTAVEMLYGDYGYTVGRNATHALVYKYNGTGFAVDFAIADVALDMTGISIHSFNDVWATTSNPDVIYHFNGRTWEYGGLGSSQYTNIVVSFDNLTSGGLSDLSMSDARTGYAVGADGVVFKFQGESRAQYNAIMAKLDNLTVSINETNILNAINNITFNDTAILQAIGDINQSIISYIQNSTVNLTPIQDFLTQMNVTINYKLDNLLYNVTYTQLYLETMINPMLNSTYQNTLQILIQLGVLEGKINETIALQNSTLNIVNQTQQDVEILLNRSNRIRAWITQ